jgi:hypothetical protein
MSARHVAGIESGLALRRAGIGFEVWIRKTTLIAAMQESASPFRPTSTLPPT